MTNAGTERASFLLTELAKKLTATGEVPTYNLTTPFRNTIPTNEEAAMPVHSYAHLDRGGYSIYNL